MKRTLLTDAPIGAIGRANNTGWIYEDIFTDQKKTKTKIWNDRKREKKSETSSIMQKEIPSVVNVHMYAALYDPKRTDDWCKCSIRRSWFQETRAEENEVINDVGFFCGNCV